MIRGDVVRLTVTDLGNLTDITYSKILVNNVAPSILGFNTTSPIGTTDPIGEGEYLEAQVTASDQGEIRSLMPLTGLEMQFSRTPTVLVGDICIDKMARIPSEFASTMAMAA